MIKKAGMDCPWRVDRGNRSAQRRGGLEATSALIGGNLGTWTRKLRSSRALDRSAGEEQPRVLFGSELAAATTLVEEDTILVYGQEQKLGTLVAAVTQL